MSEIHTCAIHLQIGLRFDVAHQPKRLPGDVGRKIEHAIGVLSLSNSLLATCSVRTLEGELQLLNPYLVPFPGTQSDTLRFRGEWYPHLTSGCSKRYCDIIGS